MILIVNLDNHFYIASIFWMQIDFLICSWTSTLTSFFKTNVHIFTSAKQFLSFSSRSGGYFSTFILFGHFSLPCWWTHLFSSKHARKMFFFNSDCFLVTSSLSLHELFINESNEVGYSPSASLTVNKIQTETLILECYFC